MRKIENFIGIILTGLFVYSLFELMYNIAGALEESPTFFIPFRINGTVVLIGLLTSLFAGIFFPLWNIEKRFNTMNVREISQFKREYKINYFQLVIGFIGLASWCASGHLFDFWWWFGSALCFMYLWWLCLTPIITRHNR